MNLKGWFGPKRIGWGVSPRTREGWLVMLAYVVVMCLPLLAVGRWHHSRSIILAWQGLVTGALFVVMWLTYAKEPPTDR